MICRAGWSFQATRARAAP